MKKIGSLFYKPKKDVKAVKAKRWNIWGILGKAIKRTCMAIGAMVLLSSLISVFLLSRVAKNTAPKLPDDIVLYFNIEDGITETQTRPSLMDPFPFMQPTLRNVIDTLEKARDDSRVRGVIFKLNGAPMSIVHVEELRQVLLSFKKRGKFTKIYATSYADPMGGLSQYYLASRNH
jgi:protease-4